MVIKEIIFLYIMKFYTISIRDNCLKEIKHEKVIPSALLLSEMCIIPLKKLCFAESTSQSNKHNVHTQITH